MRFVAVTLIVLNTIHAVAASNKVKFTEATTGGVLYKKLFLKISQYSQEKNCAGVSFLIKLQALSPVTLLKRLQHRCFPMNIVKFLRTPILKNICEPLLLNSVWPLQFQMNQGYVFPKTKQILSHGSKHELLCSIGKKIERLIWYFYLSGNSNWKEIVTTIRKKLKQ